MDHAARQIRLSPRDRFEARRETSHAIDPRRFDERWRRKWRTYLWSCAEMFRSPSGTTHLFQVLFSRGNVGAYHPMSRGYVYG